MIIEKKEGKKKVKDDEKEEKFQKLKKKKIRKSTGNEVVTLTMFCFRFSVEPKKKRVKKFPKK
jgi:hypothetical protein